MTALPIAFPPVSSSWPTVLVVHNRYRRIGGEDQVVRSEIDLLTSAGAAVVSMIYDSRNDSKIEGLMRRPDRLLFNREAYHETRMLIQRHGVQVVHCHNLFPLLSTSIFDAAQAEGVPVVQTVHNYRMGCLNGLHLRDTHICEQCRPGHHIAGIWHGCYRDSLLQSVAFGTAQTVNYWRGTWDRPALYIAPTPFLKQKLIDWNIPEQKIAVKPHFVEDIPPQDVTDGAYALFVGRLSPEKGLDVLLDVWGPLRLPLVIVGDGPLRAHLEQRVLDEGRTNVRFVGHQERAMVKFYLRGARFLVMPSIFFEIFGLVIVEAFAHGVPIVATRLGAVADVIEDGVTGLLFEVQNRQDLAAKLDQMEASPTRLAAMREAARQAYQRQFSAHTNLHQLHTIYTHVLERWNDSEPA